MEFLTFWAMFSLLHLGGATIVDIVDVLAWTFTVAYLVIMFGFVWPDVKRITARTMAFLDSVIEAAPPPEFQGAFPPVLTDGQAEAIHRAARGGR